MRELYAGRWQSLHENCDRYLAGCLTLPVIEAGLNTPAYLKTGMTSHQAEIAAAAAGIQSVGLDRFTRQRRDLRGLLLGFAAFDEKQIREAVRALTRALGKKRFRTSA